MGTPRSGKINRGSGPEKSGTPFPNQMRLLKRTDSVMVVLEKVGKKKQGKKIIRKERSQQREPEKLVKIGRQLRHKERRFKNFSRGGGKVMKGKVLLPREGKK